MMMMMMMILIVMMKNAESGRSFREIRRPEIGLYSRDGYTVRMDMQYGWTQGVCTAVWEGRIRYGRTSSRNGGGTSRDGRGRKATGGDGNGGSGAVPDHRADSVPLGGGRVIGGPDTARPRG
jgi:hypothetical protein